MYICVYICTGPLGAARGAVVPPPAHAKGLSAGCFHCNRVRTNIPSPGLAGEPTGIFIPTGCFQWPGRERTDLLRRVPLRALPAAARRGQQRRPEQQLLPDDRPAARTATRRAEYARHDGDLARAVILRLSHIAVCAGVLVYLPVLTSTLYLPNLDPSLPPVHCSVFCPGTYVPRLPPR